MNIPYVKIYTSYFYQVRFMKPYQIPMSTAIYDPLWYHQGSYNKKKVFKDKNNVINGLRLDLFTPSFKGCTTLCRGPENCKSKPDNCEFLKEYRKQLDSLDFDQLMIEFNKLIFEFKKANNFNEIPEIILLFHEVPDNPCSERQVVKQYFKDHGLIVSEFNF